MRVNYQRLSRIPLELRLRIIREYLSGEASCEELGLRYQMKLSTISQWVHRYGNADRNRIFGFGKRHVKAYSTNKAPRKKRTKPSRNG